jgi:hypothetical protein
MPPAGFEAAIPTSEQPKTHATDLPATGIGKILYTNDLQDIYGIKDNKIHRFCGRYPLIFFDESLTCFGPAGPLKFSSRIRSL